MTYRIASTTTPPELVAPPSANWITPASKVQGIYSYDDSGFSKCQIRNMCLLISYYLKESIAISQPVGNRSPEYTSQIEQWQQPICQTGRYTVIKSK